MIKNIKNELKTKHPESPKYKLFFFELKKEKVIMNTIIVNKIRIIYELLLKI